MLGKLLKYEIPAMGRKLLPLYAAWTATALLLGLTTQSAESKNEFMVVISALLYTAIATAIFVMTESSARPATALCMAVAASSIMMPQSVLLSLFLFILS